MDEKAIMGMFCQIREEIADIKKQICCGAATGKEIMDIDECSSFLGLSKSTIYKQTAARTLPFYKMAKKIWFKRTELIEWATRNRHKTVEEIENELSYNS